jgi:cell division protein FtsL
MKKSTIVVIVVAIILVILVSGFIIMNQMKDYGKQNNINPNNPSFNPGNNSVVSDADITAVDNSANDINNSDLSDNALDSLG